MPSGNLTVTPLPPLMPSTREELTPLTRCWMWARPVHTPPLVSVTHPVLLSGQGQQKDLAWKLRFFYYTRISLWQGMGH